MKNLTFNEKLFIRHPEEAEEHIVIPVKSDESFEEEEEISKSRMAVIILEAVSNIENTMMATSNISRDEAVMNAVKALGMTEDEFYEVIKEIEKNI